MKKLLPIILSVLLLFNAGGFIVVFKSLQISVKNDIRKKLKSSLPLNSLSEIKVSLKDSHSKNSALKWYDDDKEFSYGGKMYDIVSKETKGDTIYYYCINDTREEQLFAGLNGYVNKAMSDDGLKQKVLKIVFQLSQNYYIPIQKAQPKESGASAVRYFTYSEKSCSTLHEVNIPPPKSSC